MFNWFKKKLKGERLDIKDLPTASVLKSIAREKAIKEYQTTKTKAIEGITAFVLVKYPLDKVVSSIKSLANEGVTSFKLKVYEPDINALDDSVVVELLKTIYQPLVEKGFKITASPCNSVHRRRTYLIRWD